MHLQFMDLLKEDGNADLPDAFLVVWLEWNMGGWLT